MLFEKATEVQDVLNAAKACDLADVVSGIGEKITPLVDEKRGVVLLWRGSHHVLENFDKIAFAEVAKP